MYFISSDYRLAANGHTMLNACDCFTTWNCKEQTCQTKDIFGIKKLVPSDRCDTKLGKIRKRVTIMATTSRASRKTVEDAEMCVLWTLSSYMTWQFIPLLQHTETGRWPSDRTWCVNWLVHSRLASVQAGREVCPSELHPPPFHTLQKNIRPCKSVCFVYREKEKSSIRKG
jgi:hypothetical protein